MALCLTVLPYKLRLAKLSKHSLARSSHAILQLLTSRVGFFSFTESADDSISLILTSSALKVLDPRQVNVVVANERWRAMLVSEGTQ